jgi:hypothetical protein
LSTCPATPRQNYSIPISNGILEHSHVEAIGPAIWVFLWMIDHTTKEVPGEDGQFEGLVFGGAQVRASVIAADLGLSVRLVHEHIKRLRAYIRVIPMGEGLPSGYAVVKSKKWRKNQPAVTLETNDAASTHQKNLHTSSHLPIRKICTPPQNNLQVPAENPLPIRKTVQDSTKQKTVSSDVEQVYKAYPLKVGAAKARQSIAKALVKVGARGETDPATFLTDRIAAWLKVREADQRAGRFVPQYPYPATWFNGERYDDEITAPADTATTKPQHVNFAELYSGPEYAGTPSANTKRNSGVAA